MSLRSGNMYQATMQQDEANGNDANREQTLPHSFDVKSQLSKASIRLSQRSSSTTSSATKAYAKAQAARAQLVYAEREASMMKQRAELEANLHLLQCERAVAAAEAEATAYEEAELQSGELSQQPCVEDKPISTVQRACEYVQQHFPDPPCTSTQSAVAERSDSGEQGECSSSVTSKCTEICDQANSPRSCSKICLVKAYPAGNKEKAVKMYAVLDEQSNKSLAKTEFFNLFNVKASPTPYTLTTCSGKMETSGRRAVNFCIESMDGRLQLPLSPMIECDMVPDDRMEIPSPEITHHHPHLLPVADKIQPIDQDAPILLLLGRDIPRMHKVREQINGPHDVPYAQRLDLGWVVVGEVGLETVHKPSEVSVYKTNVLNNGRRSFLKPCPNSIHVKDDYGGMTQHRGSTFPTREKNTRPTLSTDNMGCLVFDMSKDENKPALSIDDKTSLATMDSKVHQNKGNSWLAPLPFCYLRRRLPSNREQALKRLRSLQRTLKKKRWR
ncbi:uncharacterized protein LOC117804989 [Notolabrus celidotus]|uniref:uncharacterized protein LOC117804989 n=1 Tax=Notolabrus celidotus TaxID=1203425 RepID=UPI0014900B5B|nr:uncharacterized protein LOC117804989 [Notolabrus celidotus]